MTRQEFETYILKTYGVEADYPWQDKSNAVFRHDAGKKWFALVMDIPVSRLGKRSDEIVDVVNLKCAPLFISSFLKDKGIYPAYHMNKAHWISVLLKEVDSDELKALLDMSYTLTMAKVKRANPNG